MRRMPSSAQKESDASGPACDRGVGGSPAAEPRRCGIRLTAVALSTACFRQRHEFTYTTPTGGQASIQVVGSAIWPGPRSTAPARSIWSTAGPTRYSKIVSHVSGGNGRAPLASILNSQLIAAGATNQR